MKSTYLRRKISRRYNRRNNIYVPSKQIVRPQNFLQFPGCSCLCEGESSSSVSVSPSSFSSISSVSSSISSASTSSPVEECTACPDGMPRQWKLVVSGVSDNLCTVCENYNGTFILTHSGGPNNCQFLSPEDEVCLFGTSTQTGNVWAWNPTSTPPLTALGGATYTLKTGETFDCLGANIYELASIGQCQIIPVIVNCCQSWPSELTVSPA